MADQELDLRTLAAREKGPAVLRAFEALKPGESLLLVDDEDITAVREALEIEHPGGCGWDELEHEPTRARLRRLAATSLPHVLCDVMDVAARAHDVDAAGAVWKLRMNRRDLDSNIVRLQADSRIDSHVGPPLDVLLMVLAGSGRVTTELHDLELGTGSLVWLPRLSRRAFAAGAGGLTYMTVHQRRKSLDLKPPPRRSDGRPEGGPPAGEPPTKVERA